MRKHILAVALAATMTLGACATNNTKTTTNTFQAKAASKTLVVKPDVELKILMASGLQETRADWSTAGTENLANALEAALKDRGSNISVMDPAAGLTEKQNQIIKLNDAVVSTSLQYDYFGTGLPTKKKQFDRTIGPGAAVLRGSTGSDYALMVRARGSFSSGGKIAMNIAMAALGGPVQTGNTQLYATLVDLDTGDIVWSNLAGAALGADLRKPEGAESVVNSLLKDFPL